jgi:hypothetical protein
LPAAQRGKPTLIGGDPQGENILYCLGNDVIIRSIQVCSVPLLRACLL